MFKYVIEVKKLCESFNESKYFKLTFIIDNDSGTCTLLIGRLSTNVRDITEPTQHNSLLAVRN